MNLSFPCFEITKKSNNIIEIYKKNVFSLKTFSVSSKINDWNGCELYSLSGYNCFLFLFIFYYFDYNYYFRYNRNEYWCRNMNKMNIRSIYLFINSFFGK